MKSVCMSPGGGVPGTCIILSILGLVDAVPALNAKL